MSEGLVSIAEKSLPFLVVINEIEKRSSDLIENKNWRHKIEEMEEQSYLLKQSAEFAFAALARISKSITCHTLEHTKQVVRAARIIGRASKLSGESLDTVMIAAWFHDVGYVDETYYHEERSASIAVKMLTTWGANSKITADVSQCILATKPPQNPKHITGMVLCDAIITQLASPQYEMHVWRLRKEAEANQRNIEFLKLHRYFTEYGQEILDRRKITRQFRQLFETRQRLKL